MHEYSHRFSFLKLILKAYLPFWLDKAMFSHLLR